MGWLVRGFYSRGLFLVLVFKEVEVGIEDRVRGIMRRSK